MNYLKTLLLSLCLGLCSCDVRDLREFEPLQLEDYSKIAHRITARTAWRLKKEKHLVCAGTGGGMMGDIYDMGMAFHYYHQVNLNEARVLMIYVLQEYLKEINSDKKVRPYLHEYPFPVKCLDVKIFFLQPDENDLPQGEISYVSFSNEKITYGVSSGPGPIPSKILSKETYEEAIKILNTEKAIEEAKAS